MKNVTVSVCPLPHFEGLGLPAYETSGSAGMDVRAAVPEGEPMVLAPGARAMVPTGLSVAIPEGYEIQVRPRSGLAAKHGLTCLNTPGTIDSDYRGEIKVILIISGRNLSPSRGANASHSWSWRQSRNLAGLRSIRWMRPFGGLVVSARPGNNRPCIGPRLAHISTIDNAWRRLKWIHFRWSSSSY